MLAAGDLPELAANLRRSGSCLSEKKGATLSLRAPDGTPQLWLDNKPAHHLDSACGGFSIENDDGWFDFWPERTPRRSGPIAIIGDNHLMVGALREACTRLHRGASFYVSDVAERLHWWIDAAARSPKVSAILVAQCTPANIPSMAARAALVAPHIPLVFTGPELSPQIDPYRTHWAYTLGAFAEPQLHKAALLACLLADMDPTNWGQMLAICDERVPHTFARHHLRLPARAEVQPVDFEDSDWAGAARALLDQHPATAVAIVVGQPYGDPGTLIRSLKSVITDQTTNKAIVVVAMGTPEFGRRLATSLAAARVPVVPADAGISGTLRHIARWQSDRSSDANETPAHFDAHRLRRVLSSPSVEPTELLHALAIPVAPRTRVDNHDAAALAGDRYGYPVTLNVDSDEPMNVWAAETREQLISLARDLLNKLPRGAKLVVSPHYGELDALTVFAIRSARYGVRIDARLGNAMANWVAPVGKRAIQHFLHQANIDDDRRGNATATLVHAIQTIAAAIDAQEALASVEVVLQIASGGVVASDAIVTSSATATTPGDSPDAPAIFEP